jgi:hypothetical protein
MNRENAILLFESLIDRIEHDQSTGKYRLVGLVSEKEFESLRLILEELGTTPPTEKDDELISPVVEKGISFPLSLESLEIEQAQSDPVLLALDFGTAMSKAFATNGFHENLLDLALGNRAGHTDVVYPVASSIFVSDQGAVYFGPDAISRSLMAPDGERERLDSPKQILSQGEISNLFETQVSEKINPTDIPITEGHLITLYLAYFTDLAGTELEERHDQSRYVLRRFTRPSWNADRADWAEEQLILMLAQAQILADTLHGQWADGLPLDRLKATVEAVRELDTFPTYLIKEGVLEAIASASSSLHEVPAGKRSLVMVVDVGAGTTDFGMFVVVHRNDDDSIIAGKLIGSDKTLRQAGDTIDALLRQYILKLAHAQPGDQYFDRLNTSLLLRIRQYKETLFRDGGVRYDLADGAAGYIYLDDFLEHPGMKSFEDNLRNMFSSSLESVDASWYKSLGGGGLNMVFTGGGAQLPMVQGLAKGNWKVGTVNLPLHKLDIVPDWITEKYSELSDEYPQLAVAIGAAADELPKQIRDQKWFGGGASTVIGGFDTIYKGN